MRKQQEREQRRRYEEMEQLRREEERRHAEREQVRTHLVERCYITGVIWRGVASEGMKTHCSAHRYF